jgi:hypothetical protein
MLSKGTYELQSSKVRSKYRDAKNTKTAYVQDAEALIDSGNYRRRT